MKALAFALLAAAAIGAPAGDARLVDAVKSGNKAAALALLNQRADANSSEADGTTALHYAVRQDDRDLSARLIQAGANVKAANRYGVTPLHLACANGNAAMIEALLKAGADANATVTEGETALMTVARTGNVDAAKVLIAHGAKVDATESWHGQTALMWAASQGHPAMVKTLIDAGANVDARQNINKWDRQTTSEPREKWLPLGGLTPLLFAARQGCLECARILADSGADIQAVDPDGISAPLIAIINGHYDVAALMLDRGTNPNLADRTGRTALYSAVDFNTMPQSNRPAPKVIDNEVSAFELVKKLIAKGANVNAQLKAQQPYRAKLDRGDDTMLTTGTTPLLRAAKAGDVPVVKFLLEKGADPKLATRNGVNPLMAAAGLGTKEEDATGRFKTEEQANETIQILLDAGLDINAADNRGQTALHAASEKGLDKIVQFLADHGAKLDAKDKQNHTPLDAAMGLSGGGGFDGSRKDFHESTVALLKKLGASSKP